MRKGRRERQVIRRKSWGIKRGESKLASNQFPMCSPQSGSLRVFHRVTQRRRGRMEIEVTRRRRGGIKRGESNLASNQFPMCAPLSGPLRDVLRDVNRDVHGVTHRREEGGRRQK